jgi:type VI secretion system secreted protein Hcp
MATSDIFLSVETATKGVLKGESRDSQHENSIDVLDWSWGMRAQTAMGAGGKAPKASLNELLVTKRVDSASTALMGAVRNNEPIKKALLTVRKAGPAEKALEYLRVTIENARITSLDVSSGEEHAIERLTFAFNKIKVEYTPQGDDGRMRGASTFETQLL